MQYEFLHDTLLYELVATSNMESGLYTNINSSVIALDQEYQVT